jgi:uncharacterized protein GlcG (DUF336 family)
MLIDTARAETERRGMRAAFAVVDAGGHVVALERMDGVEWVAVDVAIGKAYTAAAFGKPSATLADRSAELPLFAHAITTLTGGRFVPQKGGVPVIVDGVCDGAIGASGPSGEDDVAVVNAALAALRDQLANGGP